jgi:opacity protein-like surface antigen
MKMLACGFVSAVLLVCGTAAQAVSLPGTIVRDSKFESEGVEFLTVGADYEGIERDVKSDDRPTVTLESSSWSGFVGFDVAPWCTVFFTAGSSALKDEAGDGNEDARLKWSVGGSMNLWRLDIREPGFLAGRLSIRTLAEFSRYASEGDQRDTHWTDLTFALPVQHEFFVESPAEMGSEVFSLALYGGPIVSFLDGTVELSGQDIDFSEKNDLGVMAGADLYLSSNLSVGCQLVAFDEVTIRGSVRYHF